MIFFYLFIFIISFFLLFFAGSKLVKSLIGIAKFLGWREFVVAFFVMGFAVCIPNLFVDINAALHNLPMLAFGDIVGGNMVDLSLVAALAVLMGSGILPAESKMVQTSAFFTAGIAVLPLLLILDGNLSRADAIILLFVFLAYCFWLFSKEDRFKKIYDGEDQKSIKSVFGLLNNSVKIIFFLVLLLFASQGIVKSSQFLSDNLGISLATIGILIVGLGNCFPEIYFSIVSARKNQNWLILGDLMGSVIVSSTLVLGIVVLISPFEISDFSPFVIARIFTIIAALFFLVVIKTGQKITKKEGLFLLTIYIIFLLCEIFFR